MLITVLMPHGKKTQVYTYRMAYANPDVGGVGCHEVWEIMGGTEPYQISIEIKPGGEMSWECTCPDAVYRQRHCKHIDKLIEFQTEGTYEPREDDAR